MLDRRERRVASRGTLFAGALLLLAAAGALAYGAIDWQHHGCRCDESIYPDWAWTVLAALAAAAFVTAANLVFRAVRR